jgi:hypothetical protein
MTGFGSSASTSADCAVYGSVYKTGSQPAALHPRQLRTVIAVPTAPSQRIPAANATRARADSGLTV